MARCGGTLPVAGARPETPEGHWRPGRLAVLAFERGQRATARYASNEYRPAREPRRRVTRTTVVVAAVGPAATGGHSD